MDMDNQIHDEIDELRKSRTQSFAHGGTSYIKKGYLLSLLLNAALGTIQFGYSIGMWNTTFGPYSESHDWGDKATARQATIQTAIAAGSAVGALMSGPIMFIGRWKCLMLANALIIATSGLSLIGNYTVFVIARFLYGVAAGCFSVFVPKFISETAPTEVKGVAGGIVQTALTFGILISFCVGTLFSFDSTDPAKKKDQQELFVNVMLIIPIAISGINMLLYIFVFPYDTPPVMHDKQQYAKLNELMGKIYSPEVVQPKIDELKDDNEGDEVENTFTVSYGDVFLNPYYRRASYVGISLAAIQMFTGINIIMFYSSTIFA